MRKVDWEELSRRARGLSGSYSAAVGVIAYDYKPGQPPPICLTRYRRRCAYCARPYEGQMQCNGCGAWHDNAPEVRYVHRGFNRDGWS